MDAAGDLADCRACLCLASRRAARAITRHFERALRAHGIRGPQFTALVALSLGGPMTVGQLASAIGVERTTLTRNLARLEARGWVGLAADPTDGRARIVSVTRKGRATLTAALPAWRQAQAEVGAVIGAAGADSLRRLSVKPIG